MAKKKLALHWQILLGMVLGIGIGALCLQFDGGKGFVKAWIAPLGTMFINLLKMIAVPLIIGSLIKGVTDLKDISKLSTIGTRTLSFYVFTTMFSVSLGLLLVNLINPGGSISAETRTALMDQYSGSTAEKVAAAQGQQNSSPLQLLVDLVPQNLVAAASNNQMMLQVIFFVIFFGVALLMIPKEKSKPVVDFFDGFNEAILKMIDLVMLVSPFGVLALMAAMVVDAPNLEIFKALFWYALVVVLGILLLLFWDAFLYSFFTKRSPLSFLRGLLPAQLLAFSTSSSAATLPVTMECAQDRLGVEEEVASFCLPVGATVNMDGTSLYQAVAAVFIAQVFGNDLSLGQQLSIVLTATLASIGSAAVPGAGMLMLVVVLESIGVNPAGIAIILAIDRPLDMWRTVANITGDAMVACIVAKSLGKLGEPKEPELVS
jgi:Na+/H+-dicarboxylate symporter